MTTSFSKKYFRAGLLFVALLLCGTPSGDTIPPDGEGGTIGKALWLAFTQKIEQSPKVSTEELATHLIENDAIEFAGGVAPVEPQAEYFAGFGEHRITGYREAATFFPQIGSIAFVGYVFELEDGADTAAFIRELKANCNPRWNLCVEADHVVAGAVGNRVLFLMCP